MPLPFILYLVATDSATKYSSIDPQQNGIASLPFGTIVANKGPKQSLLSTPTKQQSRPSLVEWNNFSRAIEFERQRFNSVTSSSIEIRNETELITGVDYMRILTTMNNVYLNATIQNIPLTLSGKTNSTSDRKYSETVTLGQRIDAPFGRAGTPDLPQLVQEEFYGVQIDGEDRLSLSYLGIYAIVRAGLNVKEGDLITADLVGFLVREMNKLINSCACNCNYCTCNCNYACTCNCNYSDVRLKTDISFSHMFEDLSIYKFSYKWDMTKTYLGIMAQHLIGTKYENAVIKDQKGMYMVDYSKLPIQMREV